MKTLFLSFALIVSIFTSMSTEENPDSVSTENTSEEFTQLKVDNADVGIFPGSEDNSVKAHAPQPTISPIGTDLIVTGIKSAADGRELVIYATSGNIVLLTNHPDSDNGNRIEQSSYDLTIEPGEALELVYSASAGKWIVTGSF